MVSGVAISSKVRSTLFSSACEMIRTKCNWQAIADSDIEGEIRTEFEQKGFGGVSGIEFFAVIETNAGVTGNVKYLVNSSRAVDQHQTKELVWVPLVPISLEEQVIINSPSRNNPHSN